MGSEIRVLIADDHPIFRQGLRLIIEAQRDSPSLPKHRTAVRRSNACQTAT